MRNVYGLVDVEWFAFVQAESSYEDWISGKSSRYFQSRDDKSGRFMVGAVYSKVEDQSPVTESMVKSNFLPLKLRSLVLDGAPMTLIGVVALRSPSICSDVPSMYTERTRYPASTITEVVLPTLAELLALVRVYQKMSDTYYAPHLSSRTKSGTQ